VVIVVKASSLSRSKTRTPTTPHRLTPYITLARDDDAKYLSLFDKLFFRAEHIIIDIFVLCIHISGRCMSEKRWDVNKMYIYINEMDDGKLAVAETVMYLLRIIRSFIL